MEYAEIINRLIHQVISVDVWMYSVSSKLRYIVCGVINIVKYLVDIDNGEIVACRVVTYPIVKFQCLYTNII
jgi:hypothetical protein